MTDDPGKDLQRLGAGAMGCGCIIMLLPIAAGLIMVMVALIASLFS